jgi:hypothetical protein
MSFVGGSRWFNVSNILIPIKEKIHAKSMVKALISNKIGKMLVGMFNKILYKIPDGYVGRTSLFVSIRGHYHYLLDYILLHIKILFCTKS